MAATEKTATIGDLLQAGSVHVGIVAADKSELLALLVESFRNCEGVNDLKALTDSILERETMLSTGVGDGIALPHAKTSAVSKTLALLATTAAPIEYDSFDNQPVSIVFMLIGPPTASRDHIRILGRVSRLLQREQVRQSLISAQSADEIIQVLQSAEEKIPSV